MNILLKLKTALLVFLFILPLQGWAEGYSNSFLHTKHKGHKDNSSDSRRPVRMTKEMGEHQLKNMRGHLEAVSAIVSAMALKDFKKMEKAALRLASSPKMKMMCNHMGNATPGFTKMGLVLHTTADTLVQAAKKKNYKVFVKKLSATLKTCTSCHSTFKQKILSKKALHKYIMQLK
ncbi:MAG: hypothetical protein HAW63_00020 [Bdellovibrionaceae bacterium]|nr:hypothetical protein [Pseudobdellovibrionaceae bacterium]